MDTTQYRVEFGEAREQFLMGHLTYDEFEQARERYEQRRAQVEEAIYRRRKLEEQSIPQFLSSQGLFQYDPAGRCPSQELYNLYSLWCAGEKIPAKPSRAFSLYLKEHAERYHLVYTMNIPTQQGKHCRGFYGIRPLVKADTHNTDKKK